MRPEEIERQELASRLNQLKEEISWYPPPRWHRELPNDDSTPVANGEESTERDALRQAIGDTPPVSYKTERHKPPNPAEPPPPAPGEQQLQPVMEIPLEVAEEAVAEVPVVADATAGAPAAPATFFGIGGGGGMPLSLPSPIAVHEHQTLQGPSEALGHLQPATTLQGRKGTAAVAAPVKSITDQHIVGQGAGDVDRDAAGKTASWLHRYSNGKYGAKAEAQHGQTAAAAAAVQRNNAQQAHHAMREGGGRRPGAQPAGKQAKRLRRC